jgi:hypothetical protein
MGAIDLDSGYRHLNEAALSPNRNDSEDEQEITEKTEIPH